MCYRESFVSFLFCCLFCFVVLIVLFVLFLDVWFFCVLRFVLL